MHTGFALAGDTTCSAAAAHARQPDQIVRRACRRGARLRIMHVPAAAAARVPTSSGGLSSMQSCRPSAFASIASPIYRGCGQPQCRRMLTVLARRAPQPSKRANAVGAAVTAESGGLPNISTIRSQPKVEDLASLQCFRGLGRLFWTQCA